MPKLLLQFLALTEQRMLVVELLLALHFDKLLVVMVG